MFCQAKGLIILQIWWLQLKYWEGGGRPKLEHQIIDPKYESWKMPPSKEKVPGTMGKISGKFQASRIKTRGDANGFVPKLGILIGATLYDRAMT